MPKVSILFQAIAFRDQRNHLKIGNLTLAENRHIRIDAASRNTVREYHLFYFSIFFSF